MARGSQEPDDAAGVHYGVLPAKLRRPRLRPGTLDRRAITGRVLADPARLVAVVAPAGYGKTTAAVQCLARDPRRAAWVTIDSGDDDPVVLVRHVVEALHRIEPLDEVRSLATTPAPRVVEVVLPALAAALGGDRSPFVLVLDDVHLLRGTDSRRVVDCLIEMCPEHARVMLVGRSSAGLHLARRGLDGDTVEVGVHDLAFDDDEVHSLLAGALPGVGAGDLAPLVRRIDGWPAGVGFTVLARRDRGAAAVAIEATRGDDHRLAGYLDEEILCDIPASTLRFLTRAAVLDRLSGPLCDAVLERSGSAELLEALTASGEYFITGFDGDDGWKRYHRLFADLLVARLRATEPELEPELHRRAAGWFETAGDLGSAVRHAVATGDVGFAAETLDRQLFLVIMTGRTVSLDHWLALLDPDDRRANALLALVSGWCALANGRPGEAEYFTDVSAELAFDGPLPDGTVDYDVARAALRMTVSPGSLRDTLAAATTVLEAGPAASPWWGSAHNFSLLARQLAGELEDRLGAWDTAELATRGSPMAHAVVLAQRSYVEFGDGEVERAERDIAEAVAEMRANHLEDLALASAIHCVRAYAAARRGALAEATLATEQAQRVLDASGGIVPRAQAHLRLILAEAALECGKGGLAAQLVDAAAPFAERVPDAVVLHEWIRGFRREQAARDDVAATAAEFDLTAAERRVLEHLPTHLTLEQIGEHIYVSRNTVKSHTISIYRKLGVSGRGAAVERARELHLLDR